jgi:hypothetical protein
MEAAKAQNLAGKTYFSNTCDTGFKVIIIILVVDSSKQCVLSCGLLLYVLLYCVRIILLFTFYCIVLLLLYSVASSSLSVLGYLHILCVM